MLYIIVYRLSLGLYIQRMSIDFCGHYHLSLYFFIGGDKNEKKWRTKNEIRKENAQ